MTEQRQGGIIPSEEVLANGFAFSECKCRSSTVFCYCNRSVMLLLEQGQGLCCSPRYCHRMNNLLYFLCLVSSKVISTHSVEIQLLDYFRFLLIYFPYFPIRKIV